ncbi:MAG: chemotaxis protein CheX [Deltaproteobacteria bacterium]|nr:chemotaxis protein CheX [Deltaproteobacteria bacterium]
MFDDIRKKAISVVSNIFETMFFIFLELQENGEEPKGRPEGMGKHPDGQPCDGAPLNILRSEIGFQGKIQGKIRLCIPYQLARTMAGNFMGLEEGEVSESQTMDMAGELTNMISGNLFSLLDKKAGCRLTVPKTEAISDSEMADTSDKAGITINFDAEGQRIKLHLQFES